MSDPREQAVLEAAERLGKVAQTCPENEKAILRKLYEDVKKFAEEQEAKGILVDRAAFFAAGIIFHPEIETEELIQAAVDYVDKDWLFCKSSREQEQEKTATEEAVET